MDPYTKSMCTSSTLCTTVTIHLRYTKLNMVDAIFFVDCRYDYWPRVMPIHVFESTLNSIFCCYFVHVLPFWCHKCNAHTSFLAPEIRNRQLWPLWRPRLQSRCLYRADIFKCVCLISSSVLFIITIWIVYVLFATFFIFLVGFWFVTNFGCRMRVVNRKKIVWRFTREWCINMCVTPKRMSLSLVFFLFDLCVMNSN